MDFKHRNGIRICPFCKSVLKRNGHTKKGTQKWYCKKCHKSINPNEDLKLILKLKSLVKFYIKYLLGTSPLEQYGLTRQQFMRMTKQIRKIKLNPLCDILTYSKVIYLDAIYFANNCCMIARNNKFVIGWRFCKKENSYEWFQFIREFPSPEFVVSDGGSGLISAINQAWPNAKHQRCLFHVFMSMRAKLTLHPDTDAGKELLMISRALLKIENDQQKQEWLESFKIWMNQYKDFVSEKTINHETGEIWFKHKELRSAAWNLGKLILENHLFYYLIDSDVSRTTNYLEGGVNSRLKQLLYFHRRCSFESKVKLIEFYLLKRSKYFNEITSKLYTKLK